MKQFIKKITAKLGYQTERKQILILSDDWGSVRLKSLEAREALRELGVAVDANRFDKFDCLESNKDLEELFDVLSKHKDHLGNHPVITAVTNVANPDFKRIQENDFQDYFHESIAQTYERYPESDKVLDIVKQGIQQNIFVPQSHGREHLQINWWLNELQDETSFARKMFDKEFFFLGAEFLKFPKRGRGIGAAFDVWEDKDIQVHKKVIESGLNIFEQLFGYRSKVFTPPAMIYNPHIENTLVQEGINWLDVGRLIKIPLVGGNQRHQFNYLGRKKKSGLRVLVRNAVYESNFSKNDNGVDRCLFDIEQAFKVKQPAIISNHRASFVGGIEEGNRTKGLKSLDTLLNKILIKWPDVEFVSVREL